VDDCLAICVTESVCGKDTTVTSSTTATANILANDLNLNIDPASLVKIADAKHPNGVTPDSVTGKIVIDGQYGTLTVETKGADAGKATYALDPGVVPPKGGASDVFTYTIADKDSCNTSCAQIHIDIDVKQVEIPMSKAVDDCNSICVTESICGSDVIAVTNKTVATGNLLANDLNLATDPSNITKIVSGANNGVSDGNGGFSVHGAYGVLTEHADGTYSYALNNNVTPPNAGLTDTFTYTLTDAHGCSSTADLKIDIDVKQVEIPQSKAVDDCGSICVTESVCGTTTTVINKTTATGNLLSNDQNLQNDPSNITKISDAKNPNGVGPAAGPQGIISIDGAYGTLSVQTLGANAGQYTFALDPNVVPPKAGATDSFTYTLTDAHGCNSTAKINIDINVNQVQQPPVEPPCHEPPVCTPPTPPCHEPPVCTPPAPTPPCHEPPVCAPPVVTPPVCTPPVVIPPVCNPPSHGHHHNGHHDHHERNHHHEQSRGCDSNKGHGREHCDYIVDASEIRKGISACDIGLKNDNKCLDFGNLDKGKGCDNHNAPQHPSCNEPVHAPCNNAPAPQQHGCFAVHHDPMDHHFQQMACEHHVHK
jgi:VCBS repeat-containing protein